jgi:hypothetical protein
MVAVDAGRVQMWQRCPVILSKPSLLSPFDIYHAHSTNDAVTGFTKSTKRHDDILKEVLGGDDKLSDRFELRTAEEYDEYDNKKFNHCVFCAPPSGFEDYPSAVKGAIDGLWMGQTEENPSGAFVFTSSGGIYGSGGDDVDVSPIVTESSPLPSAPTPRIERLINAENEVLNHKGGSVLRLAGLYLLDRGAHNYWLGDTAELAKPEIAGRDDSLVNLLHYDDAAGSAVAALKRTIQSDDDIQDGKVFLVSDGHPLTRRQICESSLKNKRYADRTIPKFTGSKENGDPIGKVYDGSYTDYSLNWKPKYELFDKFMSS